MKETENVATFDTDKILIEVPFVKDKNMLKAIKKIAMYNRRNTPVIEVFYEPFLRRLKAIHCI